jgi:sugar lactone lactonase YvrE
MKNILRTCFWLWLFICPVFGQHTNCQNLIESAGNAEIFLRISGVSGFIHGIVFDRRGNMYIGKDNFTVLKITADKNVSTLCTVAPALRGPRSHIWNMDIGPDSCLYAAAGDRIFRIALSGEVTVVKTVAITGNFGALDIRFDRRGNYYFVCDDKVYRCDSLRNASIFINGRGYFSEGTSLCFNSDYSELYISDPPSGTIIMYPIAADGTRGNPSVLQSVYPHYIEFGKNNTMMCTPSTDTNGSYWITPAKIKKYITGDKKGGCTLKFGKGGFGDTNLYVLDFPNIIYKIDLTAVIDRPSSVDQTGEVRQFPLLRNYPNPFNPETSIRYFLPERSILNIDVVNTLGQNIRTLVDSFSEAGEHTIRWDGRDESGRMAATGMYICRMKVQGSVISQKMTLIK